MSCITCYNVIKFTCYCITKRLSYKLIQLQRSKNRLFYC
jgi:hypothetical protein